LTFGLFLLESPVVIETTEDCRRFVSENQDGDWIVHIIPSEVDAHPATNSPCILFIRNMLTGRTYYYSVNHPDSRPTATWESFVSECLMTHPNRKWALDKKGFEHMLKLPRMHDANLAGHMLGNDIFEESDYNTVAHSLVSKHTNNLGRINKSIPLLKHVEAFDDLADDVEGLVKKFEPDAGFYATNAVIDTLRRLEANGIFVDRELFRQKYEVDVGPTGLAYSQYNIYTATGRPSNRFGGINYAALGVSDGTRKCFCSRWGEDGRIVVIDYSAFHPRIISHLTNYPMAPSVNIYEYLARLYFKKTTVDEIDIANAKRLTFRQLYGGVESKYSHIKYIANLHSYVDSQWKFFCEHGYILTPSFKRKITSKHITDPTPHKVFNYILQALEGEIAIPQIEAVMNYLQNKRTRPVLYTYDAVMYDFHKADGREVLENIKSFMSVDNRFPMKVYVGKTYHDVKLMSI